MEMSVQKILEYQKIDFNIYKKEKDFAQSSEIKRMATRKEEIKNKRDLLDTLASELDKSYALLNVLEEKLAEQDALNVDFETDFSEFTELKDFDKYEKNFAKYEEEVRNLVKDIQKTISKIAEISDNNKKINDQITKLVIDFNQAKNQAEEKRKMLFREAIPFAKKLKEIEPDIEEKYLVKYKELRAKKKMPAFVPYVDGNCMGCGIGIEVEVGKNMNNLYDCAECPHCGRIVYKMN